MPNPDESAYTLFLQQRRQDFRRIARASRGEFSVDDVQQEAWLMAFDMQQKKGRTIDFSCPDDQQLLISFLYQHFVRYTEQHHRHATRLDHGPSGAPDDSHPLQASLTHGEHENPEAVWVAAETGTQEQASLNPHHSLANAWLHLLEHHHSNMKAVARQLLVSLSWCYRCCAHARHMAQTQEAMRLAPPENTPFQLQPWRRFRLQRPPLQLEMEFGEALLV